MSLITIILEFLGNNWKLFASATIWIALLLIAIRSTFMCGTVDTYIDDREEGDW